MVSILAASGLIVPPFQAVAWVLGLGLIGATVLYCMFGAVPLEISFRRDSFVYRTGRGISRIPKELTIPYARLLHVSFSMDNTSSEFSVSGVLYLEIAHSGGTIRITENEVGAASLHEVASLFREYRNAFSLSTDLPYSG